MHRTTQDQRQRAQSSRSAPHLGTKDFDDGERGRVDVFGRHRRPPTVGLPQRSPKRSPSVPPPWAGDREGYHSARSTGIGLSQGPVNNDLGNPVDLRKRSVPPQRSPSGNPHRGNPAGPCSPP
jgi:hypothetical protein